MRRMYSEMQLTTLIKNAIANGLLENTDVEVKSLNGLSVTGDSIIENMEGYSATFSTMANATYEPIYAGVVKNGNKLTLVHFFKVTWTDSASSVNNVAYFTIPKEVYDSLYPYTIGGNDALDVKKVQLCKSISSFIDEAQYAFKTTNNRIGLALVLPNGITQGQEYFCRMEVTFLLSENLVPSE